MTKFAVGCLVQWYEVKIIPEYISSLKSAIKRYSKEHVKIDFTIVTGQQLEQFDGTSEEFLQVHQDILEVVQSLSTEGFDVDIRTVDNYIYSIADYRRDFNERYCEQVDVLVWGESDMLAPKQMFDVLNSLHQQVDQQTPKYLAFFGGCKMWDDSWKPLEHPKFTDRPFIEGDTTNWWSLRYTMSEQEMDTINNETEVPDVLVLPYHKFNGCGLVISSEVVKAGANIPKGMFFVHEDTAMMYMTNRLLGNIPEYVIRNILLVHNRKHHSKRYKVKGEAGIESRNVGLQRIQHEWYNRAYEASSENLANLFNPHYKFKTWKDVL